MEFRQGTRIPRDYNPKAKPIGELEVRASHTWYTKLSTIAFSAWLAFQALALVDRVAPDFMTAEAKVSAKAFISEKVITPLATAGIPEMATGLINSATNLIIYPNGETTDEQ
jgi:hypothetical protein